MEKVLLNIFKRVVKRKMDAEGRTADDILTNDYPGLTDSERDEIKNAI